MAAIRTLLMTAYENRYRAVLCIIFVLVLGVHLYKIDRPLFGHFSSYQNVGMAAMARNMIRENFADIFNPKIDLVIDGKRALHLNQYPFPSLIAAAGCRFVGGSLEFWGRFQAVIFNLISIFLIAGIGHRLVSKPFGLLSAVIFALSPFGLIYGQMFMCEAMALCASLLGLYLLVGRGHSNIILMSKIVLAGLCFSVALMNRIHFLVLCPCYFLIIAKKPYGPNLLRFFLFLAVSVGVASIWYFHTYAMILRADHVYTSFFLQGEEWKFFDKQFLLSSEYWKRMFDTFGLWMLTPLFFPFFFLGFISGSWRHPGFRLAAAGSALCVFMMVFWASKLVEQDFYLYGIFPFVCFMTAYAVDRVRQQWPVIEKASVVLLFVFIYFLVSARFFLHPLYKFPEKNHIHLGIAANLKKDIPEDARVIVIGPNTPDLFYYLDRPGWAIEFTSVGKKAAKYLINPRRSDKALKDFKTMEAAMADPVTWIQYYIGQGADYLVTTEREVFDENDQVLRYLLRHHERINDPSVSKDCYVFRLNRSGTQL
jgi:hypothetical protein